MHVRDSAGLENVDATTLTVTVMDINDHEPVFDPDYYEGAVNGMCIMSYYTLNLQYWQDY